MEMKKKKNPAVRNILRNLAIEMLIYGILLIGYFLVALRFLAEPLARYFDSNLTLYAFLGLGLIVAQAVLLDYVVVFLIRLIGLDRIE